ncbi:hypothetical protein BGAL_0484g00010 [Botrytis galanthina]|uniref:Heterokaryon incompatibility domain-containing protein n=1 Tax=Botrytis galanthina TaxID=278940 RepID=A0A4S8QKI6_9HELO|nr:hypothetical protein BGAL_0484g00010 [Botrytis galanthina]
MDAHNEENSEHFLYKQLDESRREIRLVQLVFTSSNKTLCGTMKPVDKLRLRVEHRSLNDHVLFSALSYCWNPKNSNTHKLGYNPASQSVKIQTNDGDVFIGRNLYDFLHQLHQDHYDGWLWIDAICINQNDMAEKNWQLLEMRSIYSDAETVFMWLGVSTVETDQAMDFISQAGPEAVDFVASRLTDQASPQSYIRRFLLFIKKFMGENEYEYCEGDDEDAKTWTFLLRMRDTAELWTESLLTRGLNHILLNPYWIRIWVIQEVVLAKNAVVMIGHKKVSLQQLEGTLGAIGYCLTLDTKNRPNTSPLNYRLFSIRSLEIRRGLGDSHISLRDILWQTSPSPGRSHYEATHPQDIVLGLMGILSANEIESLSVNCETSEMETFIKVTTHFFRHKKLEARRSGNDFDLSCCPLKIVTDDSVAWKKDLPSWVPDWAEIGLHGVQPYDVNYWNYSRPCDRLTPSGVSWTRQPAYRHDNTSGDQVLQCLGCRVGVIVEVKVVDYEPVIDDHNQAPKHYDEPIDAKFHFLDIFIPQDDAEFDWKFYDDNYYTHTHEDSDDSDIEAFKNRRENQQFSEVPIDWVPRKFSTAIVKSRRQDKRQDILLAECFAAVQNKTTTMSDATSAKETELAKKAWGRTLASSSIRRTLFQTENGMTGIANVAVRPGDVVILLWETRSPVILRKRDEGGWIFCGDCYVEGIMDGEFMETAWKEEEFSIF